MTEIISDGNTVHVKPSPQGRAREAIFVADWDEPYEYNHFTGEYLVEFDYGVVGTFHSWHGRIPAEQLVGLTNSDIFQSITHAEFPPRTYFGCGCSACRERVTEQS